MLLLLGKLNKQGKLHMGMEKLDQDQLVLKLNLLRGIDLRDLERAMERGNLRLPLS